MFTVEENIRKQRFDTCLKCEFLHNSPMGVRCGKSIGEVVTYNGEEKKLCGCFMKVKTLFKASACPLGKWGTVGVSLETACEMKAFVDSLDPNFLTAEQVRRLYGYKSEIGGVTFQPSNCPPCVATTVEELKKQVRDLWCDQ